MRKNIVDELCTKSESQGGFLPCEKQLPICVLDRRIVTILTSKYSKEPYCDDRFDYLFSIRVREKPLVTLGHLRLHISHDVWSEQVRSNYRSPLCPQSLKFFRCITLPSDIIAVESLDD